MGRSITRAVSEVVDGARAPEWMDPGPAERAWKVEGRRGGPTSRAGSFPPTDEVVDHGADQKLDAFSYQRPFHHSLLLDSIHAYREHDFRRSILFSAIAMETYATGALED